ncbi:MAG: hypothetical protein GX030_04580 [Firmicutes bacterium]|nr:hypothetical protein [Bacillota bacterium]
MEKYVVGFDIDGVITDETLPDGRSIWHREIDRYFGGVNLLRHSFFFTEAYGLTELQVDQFMEERAEMVFRQVSPREGVQEVLGRLLNLGFEIHLVTARHCQYRQVTTEWLQEHRVPYSQLWMTEEKDELCAELGVRFFVDDLWENCQALLQRDIEVAMMTVPHNQGLDVPVPRVSTWNEVWDWCVKVYSLADSEATA